ncbi:MAG TPA: hypothetical protein K8V00_12155 [Ligilactobacillus acidipiscis]|uniref:Cell surface protein n=1 Tax=Ligilactobacillus acidipiscis TaxID=89059 RepID=A0A921FB24_9LACO|nr:hypothetical protein [Ligilactobacillus acidipiscis]
MKQINFSKKFLLVVTFLFSLIIGFNVQSVKADTTTDQIPGQYTAHVTYLNADKPTEDSMIESGGLWDKNVKYTVAADGSADLTIKQDKMMNYMAYIKYVGQNPQAQPVDAQKVDNGDGNTGSWKAHLTKNQTTELKTGADITISMQYTVPGLFTHNVGVLMQIDSIDEPDRVAYEQNQKLQQQNNQLQKQLNSLQEQIKNNSQLNNLKKRVAFLTAQNENLATKLRNTDIQSQDLQPEVSGLQRQADNLQKTVTDLQKNQQSSPATNSGQSAPKSQTYIATVNYTKPGSTENSVLNSFFGDKITFVTDANGNVTVKIPQSNLMYMMNSVTFNGQKMTKGANEWTLNYRGKAADLVAGKQIKIGVSYNLGSSVSTHDAIANIKSISPDGFGTPVKPTTPEPGQKVQPQKQPGTLSGKQVSSLTYAGEYTANVRYLNYNNTNEDSMINGGIWSKKIKLVKNADGTVTVTIYQQKMIDYMSLLFFDGVQMKKIKQGEGAKNVFGYGYWTATIPATKAQNLKVGNKIVVSMTYTVPGVISHSVKAYVAIDSIITGSENIDNTLNNNDPSETDETTTSTPVGYDQGQNGVPVDGMPVSADPALLPQTGEKEHQDNNALTVGVVMFVVLISGITGFDIYRRKQNA